MQLLPPGLRPVPKPFWESPGFLSCQVSHFNRPWYHLVFGALSGSDTWQIEVHPEGWGDSRISVVHSGTSATGTPAPATTVWGGPGPSAGWGPSSAEVTTEPAVYELFFARLDRLLGLRKNWVSCSGAEKTFTNGSLVPLCRCAAEGSARAGGKGVLAHGILEVPCPAGPVARAGRAGGAFPFTSFIGAGSSQVAPLPAPSSPPSLPHLSLAGDGKGGRENREESPAGETRGDKKQETMEAVAGTVFRPSASLLASSLPACGQGGRPPEALGRCR